MGFSLILVLVGFSNLRADDSDPRLRVLDCVGQVTAFRDETDETTRLRIDQHVDDGDSITTGPKSEVVLRLKNRVYLHLAQNSRLSISRLRFDETRGLTFPGDPAFRETGGPNGPNAQLSFRDLRGRRSLPGPRHSGGGREAGRSSEVYSHQGGFRDQRQGPHRYRQEGAGHRL